jgi:3-oxoacyl-[acyl-carrier protein] reductase
VVISDINEEKGKETSKEIESLGQKSFFIKTDVSKKKDLEDMVKSTVDHFGRLDIAVNNAGVTSRYINKLIELDDLEPLEAQNIPESEIRYQMDVMLVGVLMGAQVEAVPMIKQKYGRIINMCSMEGTIVMKGLPGHALYCAIKAGVKHMTKALAADWAKYKINVNSISPAHMLTPPGKKIVKIPEYMKLMTDGIPLDRIGDPDELAGATIFLASDAASFVTGHDLLVDGGATIW